MAARRQRKRTKKSHSRGGAQCKFCPLSFSDNELVSHVLAEHPEEAARVIQEQRSTQRSSHVRGSAPLGDHNVTDGTRLQRSSAAQLFRKCKDCDQPAMPGEDRCFAHREE